MAQDFPDGHPGALGHPDHPGSVCSLCPPTPCGTFVASAMVCRYIGPRTRTHHFQRRGCTPVDHKTDHANLYQVSTSVSRSVGIVPCPKQQGLCQRRCCSGLPSELLGSQSRASIMEVSLCDSTGGLSFAGIIDVVPLSCHRALSLAWQIQPGRARSAHHHLLPG